jgi:hypothetical protein
MYICPIAHSIRLHCVSTDRQRPPSIAIQCWETPSQHRYQFSDAERTAEMVISRTNAAGVFAGDVNARYPIVKSLSDWIGGRL